MQTVISNEFLNVTIDTHGAEVVSVKNSKGEELIWQADPAIWDRHSPVLFPWAGRLANGELIHNGKHYSGGQHGFIRDLEHLSHQDRRAELCLCSCGCSRHEGPLEGLIRRQSRRKTI